MAWRAAPYLHPRLQALDASVKVHLSISERLERALERMRKAEAGIRAPAIFEKKSNEIKNAPRGATAR
jgi:hypothetical protein